MPDAPAPRKRNHIRFFATVLGVIFVVVFFLPFFAQPRAAQALPGESMAAAVWTFVKNRITDAANLAKKYSADIAFKNALKVYMTKVAEDTAVWLASAGSGQKPLFVTDPHYWKNLTDAAAGDFLDTIATKNFGVDVCAPADIHTQFSIQSAVNALTNPANFCTNQCNTDQTQALNADTFTVGQGTFVNQQFTLTVPQAKQNLQKMQSDVAGPDGNTLLNQIGVYPVFCDPAVTVQDCIAVYAKDIDTYEKVVNQNYRLCLNLCSANKRVARCTLSEIQANVQNAGVQLQNGEFIVKFSRTFDPGENDIGQILTLAEEAKQAVLDKVQQDQVTRGNGDTLPVVDPVTGEVKTPASLVQGAAQQLTQDPSGKVYSIYTGSPVADAIGVFTNTLTKQLLKRIFEQGFNPKANPATSFASGTTGFSGSQAARTLFASLAKVDYNTGGVSASLADLTSCPDTGPGPNNCVIEEGFRQAIEQGLTIKEAIDANLLHGDWPVGFTFSNNKQSVEPSFKEGYPYRSLLILRRLRILPVGWELAAQHIRDYDTQQYSLQSLIDAYNRCGQDPNTTADWACGLIDPNWVLKSPETFCRFSGATAAITSNDYFPNPLFPDAPQVQQIGRADECVDEQTCLQQDENGNCKAFGYCIQERSSWKFDAGQCTPAYHSCEAFADPSGAESAYLTKTLDYSNCSATNAGCKWYCSDYNTTTGAFSCTASSGNKEQFTSKVVGCPADAVGCTEYIRTTNGTNLIANGGFEQYSGQIDNGATFDTFGWTTTGMSAQAVSDANSGSAAALLQGTSGQEFQSVFDTKYLLNGQSTTLSFYGKASGGACSGYFGMRASAGGAPYFVRQPVDYTSNWQRYTATLTYDPALTYDATTITTFFELSGCSATIDDVQMEYGTDFSQYKDYGSMNKVYLNGNRMSCRPEEVGCDLYSSATDTIPGVVTSADYCPLDQVGCRAFLEVPVTDNGADPNNAVRTGKRCSQDQSKSCLSDSDCTGAGSCLPSVSLIPKTGQTCSAAYVGCEEYTNLDTVAQGGEGKEYYTYIRECVKPTGDPNNEKTFYTWVGSDTRGFQLKSYLLKPTDQRYSGPGDTVAGGPAYNQNADPNDPNLCNETIYNSGDNPDCRKFYDASINFYYRLYSKTITVSEDCHPLRNTVDSNIYNAIPSEGTTCPASAAQCREYRGSSGFNTRTILKDTFDDGDTFGWDGATWSTESLIFGGGSAFSGGTMQTNTDSHVTEQLEKGRSYIVSFWAGAGNGGSNGATLSARFSHSPAGEAFEGNATLHWDSAISGPEWNFYTLGPLHLDRDVDPDEQLQFSISGGSGYFLDTVKLYEVADNLYMIKGTPTLCTGNENCDLYRNTANKTVALKSFTRLCSQDKVGCEAMINTQNSDSPFSQVFQSPEDISETKTVTADVVDLVVNNPKNYCKAEEQGCTRLGSPTIGSGAGYFCSNDPTKGCTVNSDCGSGNTCTFQEETIKSYDTVFLVNDPDTYGSTLCWSKEVSCEAWKSTLTGATTYFHRPEPYTCDFRTVVVNNQSFTGWFRTGTSGLSTSDACPTISPAPPAQNGIVPVVPYTQPAGYCLNNPSQTCSQDSDCGVNQQCLKWAGVCPAEQSGCKEYRDTSDPANCRSDCLLTNDNTGKAVPVNTQCAIDPASSQNGCRGYWYLSQSVESNATDCNGSVNDEIGCKQFYSPDPK